MVNIRKTKIVRLVRGTIKAFFKSFIITFVAAMVFTIVNAAYQEVEKIWQELEIPYDVKSEYLIMAPLGTLQIKLMKAGINQDNWIQKTISSCRKTQYEKAIKKIPEDDLVRIWFWYVYKLWPVISGGNYDPKDYVDDVMYLIEKSLTLPSKSKVVSHSESSFT